MFRTIAIFAVFPFIPGLMSLSHAMPYHFVDGSLSLQGRTNPYFPAQPPSCPVCQQNYDSISECAQVAPVFANFSMILFNPGAFTTVIKCACNDTFEAVYPQCVDCFVQTGQTALLNTQNAPAVVEGMRKVCSVESTLTGTSGGTTKAPLPLYCAQLVWVIGFVGLWLVL